MKKFAYVVLVSLAALALVGLGWFLGRRTTGDTEALAKTSSSDVSSDGAQVAARGELAAKTPSTGVSSDLLKMEMFNTAYAEVTVMQTVIEQLDSGRIDDAKELLRIHHVGRIFDLDAVPEAPNISPEEMAASCELNARIYSSHGSMRKMADKILARVAGHRAEHPWTYKGDLPHPNNAEVEAKLDSILKRASESQK
jgi:hypothetical protein